MMFLVIGAVLLVATFLIAVGLVSLLFIKHPNTSVSTPAIKDLPHELAQSPLGSLVLRRGEVRRKAGRRNGGPPRRAFAHRLTGSRPSGIKPSANSVWPAPR